MTSPTQLDHKDAQANHTPVRIDLNTAPEDVLVSSLSAVGPARIEALKLRRSFRNWEEVARVPGISQTIIEQLKKSGAGLSLEP